MIHSIDSLIPFDRISPTAKLNDDASFEFVALLPPFSTHASTPPRHTTFDSPPVHQWHHKGGLQAPTVHNSPLARQVSICVLRSIGSLVVASSFLLYTYEYLRAELRYCFAYTYALTESVSPKKNFVLSMTAPKEQQFASEESPPTHTATFWKSKIPEERANIVSRLLFLWVQPLFSQAARLRRQGDVLEEDDLIPLADMDHARRIASIFDVHYAKYGEKRAARVDTAGTSKKKGKKQRNAAALTKKDLEQQLKRTLFSVMGWRFIIAGIIKMFNSGLQFTFPLLLSAVLRFIEESQAGVDPVSPNKGYWLSALLFAAMASKAVTENIYFHLVYRCGVHARIAVSGCVYEKALRLPSSEKSSSVGELVNLMMVDATKIELFVPQIHVLWDGLLQIFGYTAILYSLIGWSCFVGMAVLLASGPLQAKIAQKQFGLNRKMVVHTDSRVRTTNEAIQGIQFVKTSTFEDKVANNIADIRGHELKYLKISSLLRGFSRSVVSSLPGIVAVVSFIVYASVAGGTISASILFAALAAFDQLRFPLIFYPVALAQLAQASISIGRVSAFLGLKESVPGGKGHYESDRVAMDGGGDISIDNAYVYWSDPTVPFFSVKKDEDKEKIKQTLDVTLRETGSQDSEEGVAAFPRPVLSDVSFQVGSGDLCAVIGRVGSGKSSLCSALLNESILGEGRISIKGRVAYVAQTAWILNATVRDNILFGADYDEDKYQRVLKACQLEQDLVILDKQDLTEIGERGINLSGGQKQRVSLARAAYSAADIIILDDPLSALDPKVAERVFTECILGLMQQKTRLLVTNQLQFLKKCSKVVVLGDGGVLEEGSCEALLQTDGEVKRLLKELNGSKAKDGEEGDRHQQEPSSGEGKDEDATLRDDAGDAGGSEPQKEKKKEKKDGTLVTKEERALGAVKWKVYSKYFAAGGGSIRFAFVYFTFVLCAAVELWKTSMISLWTADPSYERFPIGFYMGLYASTAIALGFVTFIRSFNLALFGVRASQKMHDDLLASILAAPMSFFDTTPTGRIISRFSKDLFSIDSELSEVFDFFLWCSLYVVVSLGTITFATPWFGVAIVPIAFIYLRLLNYFRDVSRETKRLDSISRSPVYAHFSESLGGLATIRAYAESERFTKDFFRKVDTNTKAYMSIKVADRWLSVRLELLGSITAGLAALFASNVAVSSAASGLATGSSFASLAGLSLTYAISVTGLMNWTVRSFANLEAAMNASERVLFYSEEIPQEAAPTSELLEQRVRGNPSDPPPSDPSAFAVAAAGGSALRPKSSWPDEGVIILNNLYMRYRKDSPIVLKGLNIKVLAGEKVGVVGRTGSGKSSLLMSLMRLVEPELSDEPRDYQPPITIDGIDCLRIGLKDLRSKIGIVPQNPVMFEGTLRSNLDPFDEYSDGDVWKALEGCGMVGTVRELGVGLMAEVTEYGENWSQGQRQLLCLGRALLRKCKVLLLDECTSSLDFETDREIQKTIRTAFAECTVLTIAHRISTILDSDKILVMDDGVAAEFSSPKALLQDPSSLFSDIVRHAEAEDNN